MDLFDHHRQTQLDRQAPLAARMRPRTLDEFIGQDAIIGPGRLLRRAIAADQLTSLIFYGPPGTGKTTLAQIIANTTQAHFIAINAVLAGVKEIREAIASAQTYLGQYGRRTILFVDEVHRFNKAQQDALLPWVENGTIVLIGATTENPYFEVNKALVSRSRLFQLQSLTPPDLNAILDQSLQDSERGYGDRAICLEADARNHLVNICNGDARTLLNALELAILTTSPNNQGEILISLAVAEDSIQRRAVLYDKEGDAHFDTISAFIKSIRGSDPDAALYWLARMIYSGEDPRFILRRLLILASEDIGLADPQAIAVVTACATSFDRIGLPEGQYPLAQATLYLATAPKSNSVMGYFEALKTVEQERSGDIPNALKDANRDKQSFGHGANYQYPHAYRDHWVAQQYLPTGLQGQAFYQPSTQGYEATIALQVSRRREAQLAALTDQSDWPEVLSFSPPDQAQDRWLQRAMSQTSERLGICRDRLFAQAQLQRHHRVLVLNAGSGLLLWEAIRQVPEGGVTAWVKDKQEAQTLAELAHNLPELNRPDVHIFPSEPLQKRGWEAPFSENARRAEATTLPLGNPALQFERILGRNVFAKPQDFEALQQILTPVLTQSLAPHGKLILVEQILEYSQRLYHWVDRSPLGHLGDRWVAAEEALYQPNSLLTWDAKHLQEWLESVGLQVTLTLESTTVPLVITVPLIDRWFGPPTQPAAQASPGNYSQRLQPWLSELEMQQIQQQFERQLLGKTVTLNGAIAWITAASHGSFDTANIGTHPLPKPSQNKG